MSLGVVVLVGGMILISLTALIFLIWGFKTGQFKNLEETKYQVLDEKEPQGWGDEKGEKR